MRSRPTFEGARSRRKETTKQNRSCTIEGDNVEAVASVGNMVLALADTMVGQSNVNEFLNLISVKNQALSGQQVAEDSVEKTAKILETFSESEMSPNDDGQRGHTNPPVAWREPKRERKIQTSSLVLRRKKNKKQRSKHREPLLKQAHSVLRLRGGEKGEDLDVQLRDEVAQKINVENVDMEDDVGLKSIHDVLRLRGGGKGDSSTDEENEGKPPPKRRLKKGKDSALHYPDQLIAGSRFEKSCQRPAPLDPPREQDFDFGNMTAELVENEDGSEIFSPELDSYKRTRYQMKAVKEAGADQRKVGGGVYQNKDGSQMFLTIQKGWMTKDIGLKLATVEDGHIKTVSNCFAMMEYEPFRFSRNNPGLRIRQKQPQETHTGYIWKGFGGDLVPVAGMCRVYAYCERAGERDLHFSELGCERLSEAPGASQLMCSNMNCGVVKWHLSQKEFQYDNNGQWKEITQNDFALVVFKSDTEELVWTELPAVGESVRSRWVRLENSEQFDGVHVDAGSKQRIKNFLDQNRLPQFVFPVPRYEPLVQRWQDQEALRRQVANCDR